MSVLVPKGYRLISLSELPGTGSIVGKIYYNDEVKKMYLVLIDPAGFEGGFGPFPPRAVSTILNVLTDANDMRGKPVAYLEE